MKSPFAVKLNAHQLVCEPESLEIKVKINNFVRFSTSRGADKLAELIGKRIEKLEEVTLESGPHYFVIDVENRQMALYLRQAIVNRVLRYFKKRKIQLMRFDEKSGSFLTINEPI